MTTTYRSFFLPVPDPIITVVVTDDAVPPYKRGQRVSGHKGGLEFAGEISRRRRQADGSVKLWVKAHFTRNLFTVATS